MSEDFSDDFVVEEESEGTNRNFLVIAGSLIGLFIVITACVLIYAFTQRDTSSDATAATTEAIIAINATTEAENTLVAQTIEARETEAARPTEPPTETPTVAATEAPTDTPAPTNTPVVQPPEEGTAEGDEASPTPNLEGTSIFGGDGGFGSTPTPVPGAGAGDGGGTLPQTGVGVAGVVAIAAGLLFLLVVARRLRTSQS